jgi:hypothetical protein
VYVNVCVRERESVYVNVCVRERERECVCECVCERERGSQHEDVDDGKLIRHCRRRAERMITDRRIAMQPTVQQCQGIITAYL